MTAIQCCRTTAVTQRELEVLYDKLDPVGMEALIGTWKVDPSYAETPGGKMFIESGWWGVRFVDSETVDPLLYPDTDGTGVFAADLVSLLALFDTGSRDVSARRRDVETMTPNGRVRSIEYRGVVSSALIYDRAPVIDYLRAVDRDTIVAAVERRGMVDRPAYALLRRCAEPR